MNGDVFELGRYERCGLCNGRRWVGCATCPRCNDELLAHPLQNQYGIGHLDFHLGVLLSTGNDYAKGMEVCARDMHRSAEVVYGFLSRQFGGGKAGTAAAQIGFIGASVRDQRGLNGRAGSGSEVADGNRPGTSESSETP